MSASERSVDTPSLRVRLSLLWVFMMFNMVFADILSFMYPGFLGEVMGGRAGQVVVTPGFLLAAAVLTEIPIAMIVLSRILEQRANRWANIVASVVTIVYVAGGSSTYPHGIFFSGLEIACGLLIIGYAWRWCEPGAIVGAAPDGVQGAIG